MAVIESVHTAPLDKPATLRSGTSSCGVPVLGEYNPRIVRGYLDYSDATICSGLDNGVDTTLHIAEVELSTRKFRLEVLPMLPVNLFLHESRSG